MTLNKKHSELSLLYHNYLIKESEASKKGAYIPAEYIMFNHNGDKRRVFVGDGTINIVDYVQYQYARHLNGDPEAIKRIKDSLDTLYRLSQYAYEYFASKYPEVYFTEEKGFFLRDDVDSKTRVYPADSTDSSFSVCMEGINDDPCHSPFVSQDQIWNLAPVLSFLADHGPDEEIKGKSRQFLFNILEYVIRNKHVIYNPYYSAVKHNWTYLPPFNTYFYDRVNYRNRKLKYDIKVKRGANNWYYGYGFRKTFERVGGSPSKWGNALYALIYYPLTFVADLIYFPLLADKLGWVKRKDNSYYCLASGGNIWYGGMKRFFKRALKGFKKDGSYVNVLFLEAIKQGRLYDLDPKDLENYLNNYPAPDMNGTVYSPVKFLTVYQYYKLLKK